MSRDIDWIKRAEEFILKIPMYHHIKADFVKLEYYGDTYNNALDCFVRCLAAEYKHIHESAALRAVAGDEGGGE